MIGSRRHFAPISELIRLTHKALSVLLSETLARREGGEGHEGERCGAESGVRKEPYALGGRSPPATQFSEICEEWRSQTDMFFCELSDCPTHVLAPLSVQGSSGDVRHQVKVRHVRQIALCDAG